MTYSKKQKHTQLLWSKNSSDLSDDEINTISEAVGVSAVRFNMVKVNPDKGFTFRWEDALSLRRKRTICDVLAH